MAGLARDVAGRRYAGAIMEIARANASFAHWQEAIDGLDALTSQRPFVTALQADGMTDERFGAIVEQVVPGIAPVELNLFRLLRRKGRLALGPSIASYYRERWDQERGIERAVVRTAVPLEESARAAMAQRLSAETGKQVELEAEVDASLIGGAVIRIGDRMVDGSTRTRLQLLRGRLQQGMV